MTRIEIKTRENGKYYIWTEKINKSNIFNTLHGMQKKIKI